MHVPDGFISAPVAVCTGLLSAGAIAISLGQVEPGLGRKKAEILGLVTAFIFAAQMINFPVTGGTSGHLLGGALAAVILGSPWLATLCITVVLLIQAVIFADGGITALGANIFNMGIVGVWVGWGLTQILRKLVGHSLNRLPFAAGVGAGVSVVIAAIACSIELAVSHTASLLVVLPAMTGIHTLIGVGEGIITAGVIAYLVQVRADLFAQTPQPVQNWLTPCLSILGIAGILSLFASSWPDGLDSVAIQQGFSQLAANIRISIATPFADYSVVGLGQFGTSVSGIIGVSICFITALGLGKLISNLHHAKDPLNV